MIKSIHLKNWRSHADTTLEFAKGTNALVGIMGSGKSSVLDALCFAFYGTFPRLQRRDAAVADIVRTGEKSAEVTVVFDSEGEEYSVWRKISGAGSEAEARKAGKLADKGPKAATKYVESVLKVDYDLFTRAIYSEQNKIDYILSLGPKERKAEIDGLLGLDKFEEARQGATGVANKLGQRRAMLEEQASADKLAAARKMKNDAEESVKKASAGAEGAKAEKEKAAKQEAGASGAWNAQAKLKERHESLKLDAERRKAIAERLEKDIAGAKQRTKEEVLGLEKEAASIQEKIAQKKTELASLNAKANSFSSEIGSIEAGIRARKESGLREAGLKKEIEAALAGITLDQAGKEAEIVEERLEQKKAEAMSLRGKIAELEKSLAELKRDMAHCPVCETELSPEKKKELRTKREADIADAKAGEKAALGEAAKLEKEFKARIGSLARAEIAMKSLAGLSAGKPAGEDEASLNAKLASAKAALAKTQESRQASEQESEALLKSLDEIKLSLREEQELGKKRREQGENMRLANEAQKALGELGFSQTAYDGARKGLEDARIALGVAAEKEKGALRELGMAQQMLAQAASEEKNLAGFAGMAAAYADEEQKMVVFKNSLAEAQAQIRQELVGAINSAMEEIWPTVYPYGDYKSVRIQPDAKDYSIEMMALSGEWKRMDAVASGGERACACLALRAAFAMVLTPNLSWLILDEPTHNLDTSAVSALAETLRDRLPKIVEQIFVITHDQALMDSEFALAYKFSRDKERNMPSSVERA